MLLLLVANTCAIIGTDTCYVQCIGWNQINICRTNLIVCKAVERESVCGPTAWHQVEMALVTVCVAHWICIYRCHHVTIVIQQAHLTISLHFCWPIGCFCIKLILSCWQFSLFSYLNWKYTIRLLCWIEMALIEWNVSIVSIRIWYRFYFNVSEYQCGWNNCIVSTKTSWFLNNDRALRTNLL